MDLHALSPANWHFKSDLGRQLRVRMTTVNSGQVWEALEGRRCYKERKSDAAISSHEVSVHVFRSIFYLNK